MAKIPNCARLAAFLALLAPFSAGAQKADPTELETVTHIAQCMVDGLPDDWVAAQMLVDLRASQPASA